MICRERCLGQTEKEQEEGGGSGFRGQLRFTSYSFDPVNYVNPTGEIANIVVGGIAGA